MTVSAVHTAKETVRRREVIVRAVRMHQARPGGCVCTGQPRGALHSQKLIVYGMECGACIIVRLTIEFRWRSGVSETPTDGIVAEGHGSAAGQRVCQGQQNWRRVFARGKHAIMAARHY